MMIIPAIDLLAGQLVRLHQGNYQQTRHYPLSAVQQALAYQQQGAQILHLVDLTGAKDPRQRQLADLHALIKPLSIPVQIGGGIRQLSDIEQLLDLGVQRVVIGSLAILQPALVIQALHQYGAERIVLALDVRPVGADHYQVAVQGWQQDGQCSLQQALAQFIDHKLRYLLCTDISRDGTLSGTNQALYQFLKQRYPQLHLQASGGVHSLNELQNLAQQQIDDVIIGRALLENRFSLMEAQQCWQNASSPV